MRLSVSQLLGFLSLFSVATSSGADDLLTDYHNEVRPILAKLCFDCHGPDKAKGDLRIDTLNADLVHGDGTGADAETWLDALDQINLEEMPPSKSPQPTSAERQQLVDWIGRALRAAAEAQRYADGRVVSRRLTRYEYANTLRDLLGLQMDFARELPPDPASPEGFLNNGNTLEMSGTQVETYLAAARQALATAIVEEGAGKPEIHRFEVADTAVGKLPRRKDGGAEPVNPEFVVDVKTFPREGEFRLTIRAGAQVPAGHDFPRMRVSLGNVPGIIHVPRKLVGEVDVTAPAEAPETFEFRGRIEDFPQPGDQSFGSGVSFHGMVVLIDFLDAEGRELRYADRTYSDPKAGNKKQQAEAEAARKKAAAELPPDGERLDVLIDSVVFEAPTITTWPPPTHTCWLAAAQGIDDEIQRAEAVVGPFLERAFRRPVTEAETASYVALFEQVRPRTESFNAAIREVFAAALVSPHFLYRIETRENPEQTEPVTDHELAGRLSYFLWSTLPDTRLLDLANRGRLSDPEVLAGEIERLLDDRRTTEFADRFADQWFDLDALDRVAVNPEFYPDFDNDLKDAMRTEARGVMREILLGDLSCLELIDSNWTVANRALAVHYGLADRPRTGEFRRVSLAPGERRGGILSQGAFLVAQSDGQMPHPIKRAVWILDRLLDSPPPPPPPDVPVLDPESADLAGLSLKEQLAVHREKESCRDCHLGIDPWGIPLEHFDATGRWRETAPVRLAGKGKKQGARAAAPVPADATTTLPDGTAIDGLAQLKRYLLLEQREAFARSVVKRLMSYALGRSLDFGDRETVERLTVDFIENDFRLRHLIVALATDEVFRTK